MGAGPVGCEVDGCLRQHIALFKVLLYTWSMEYLPFTTSPSNEEKSLSMRAHEEAEGVSLIGGNDSEEARGSSVGSIEQ